MEDNSTDKKISCSYAITAPDEDEPSIESTIHCSDYNTGVSQTLWVGNTYFEPMMLKRSEDKTVAGPGPNDGTDAISPSGVWELRMTCRDSDRKTVDPAEKGYKLTYEWNSSNE